MEIKELNADKLKEFINSQEFRELKNLPISFHRALSHLNNPRLHKNDVLLLLAYNDEELVGYLGALPDDIFVHEKKIHVAWLSCMWVHSKMRGKGVAPYLLGKMNELWSSNLLITNYTPTAKKAYDKINVFTELKFFIGIRGYLRLNLHQLQILKNPTRKKILWLYRITDILFNVIFETRLMFFY
ncbi:MAG: GNAT family N-acetyltransferase, partial [Bacteroidota bacterium]